MKKLTLKPGKEESLLRHHPWVFSGALSNSQSEHESAGLKEGETVEIYSSKGVKLATGHYQIGSIAVRILEFGTKELSDNFYQERLKASLNLRKDLDLATPKNNCYRLVHGEGDFLPGLVVDVYGDTAVMQAHSPGMHFDRLKIADALVSLPEAHIKNVYYKSDTTLPFKANLEPVNEYLIGKYDGCVAMENGLLFNIDWLKGQKTGFFIDQRENRRLLEKYASKRKVLNMFCYTGGFSVYAMRGGASKVVSVDSSSKAIELTEANVKMNFQDDRRHSAIAEDAFKYLESMPGDEYDLIILDPPAFAKHRSALKNGLTGYRRLNLKAFEKIKKGGVIFTFSCSQVVTKEMFRLAVFTAASQSGRKVRILHQLTQPADHPVDISHPEGEYLKGLVLYVE